MMGLLGSQLDALTCSEAHLQNRVRWLDLQQVQRPGRLSPMLTHHPLTGQPSHQTMGGFVLSIPETFEMSFHLHACPPESKAQTATSSIQGAFTPYYSVMR